MGCAAWGWRFDEGLLGTDNPRQAVHVGATDDKKILELDRSETSPNGQSIGWICERQDLDFGDRNKGKIIKRVWPHLTISGSASVTVQVAARDGLDGSIGYQNFSTTFDPNADQWVDIEGISGKLISFRFTDANATRPSFWGFDVEWEEAGQW